MHVASLPPTGKPHQQPLPHAAVSLKNTITTIIELNIVIIIINNNNLFAVVLL